MFLIKFLKFIEMILGPSVCVASSFFLLSLMHIGANWCFNYKNAKLITISKNPNEPLEKIQNLLNAQADPNTNICSSFNATRPPLHTAVINKRLDLVKILLKYNANPNLYDDDQNTPLYYALMNPHDLISLKIIKSLLKAGASLKLQKSLNIFENFDTNDKELYGGSFLHQAIHQRWPIAVQMLLKAGADPNLFNTNHHSPLYLAISLNEVEIVKILLEFGANKKHLCRDLEDAYAVSNQMTLESPINWLLFPDVFLKYASMHSVEQFINLIQPIDYPLLTASLILKAKNNEDPRVQTNLKNLAKSIRIKEILRVFYAKKILDKFFNYQNFTDRKNLNLLKRFYPQVTAPKEHENKPTSNENLQECKMNYNLLESLQHLKQNLKPLLTHFETLLNDECAHFNNPAIKYLHEKYTNNKTIFEHECLIRFAQYYKNNNQHEIRPLNNDSKSSVPSENYFFSFLNMRSLKVFINAFSSCIASNQNTVSKSESSFVTLYLCTNEGHAGNKEKNLYKNYLITFITLSAQFYQHLEHILVSQGTSLESKTVFEGKEILSHEDLVWIKSMQE